MSNSSTTSGPWLTTYTSVNSNFCGTTGQLLSTSTASGALANSRDQRQRQHYRAYGELVADLLYLGCDPGLELRLVGLDAAAASRATGRASRARRSGAASPSFSDPGRQQPASSSRSANRALPSRCRAWNRVAGGGLLHGGTDARNGWLRCIYSRTGNTLVVFQGHRYTVKRAGGCAPGRRSDGATLQCLVGGHMSLAAAHCSCCLAASRIYLSTYILN